MMLLLTSLLIALGATPRNGDDLFALVPVVVWHTPDELEDVWKVVRRIKGAGAVRVKAYDAQGLERSACDGVLDLRALPETRRAGLVWQGNVALREWARPALARVLIAAHAVWQAKHPGQAIGIGDVAQAGCGQVDPGTLTRWVQGADAHALSTVATLIAGVPTAFATTIEGGKRVLNERRVVGRDASGDERLFVHLRRYREVAAGAAVSPSAAAAGGAVPHSAAAAGAAGVEAKVQTILASAELAIETSGVNAAGVMEWRQRWVDTKHFRQAIIVVSNRRRPFRLSDASDVRLSPWAPARPGEARGERRWTRTGDAWQAWLLIEEGAHVTHMAGLDADLSYPMKVPARRFALDSAGIDLAATWDWFETLDATATALGTPIDRIVVGAQVLPRLMQVPGAKQSRLARAKMLKIVANHDDHHHLRLARPTPEIDAAAKQAIESP